MPRRPHWDGLYDRLRSDDSVLRFLIVETVADNTRIASVLPGGEDDAPADGDGERQESEPANRGADGAGDDTAPSHGTISNTIQYNI